MFRTLFLAASCAVLAGPVLAEPMIMNPYARASSPVAKAGAAFMVIHGGDQDDRLIAVQSDVAVRVELHTHIMTEDGLARMVKLEDGIDVPSGSMVELKRGGMHVMFMGLKDPFLQDDALDVTLIFEQAGEIEIAIPVDLTR